MDAPIAIVGANGVFARHLMPRLAAAGLPMRAIVRRPEAAGAARACGADVRVADLFDPASLRAALEGAAVCVNVATSLPGPAGRGSFDANDRLRREGTPMLVEACRVAGVGRILQQGISWVGAAGEMLADETSVYVPADDSVGARAIRAALEMEETIRASSLDWIILRGGLFYGPGTGFDDHWFSRAAAGKLRLPGDGAAFVSQVHIADMAAATLAALQAWPSRETFIVTDDRPSRWRDVLGFIAEAVGAPPPAPGGLARFPSFRMCNAKAKRMLGWAPAYPDYRAGLAR
jgi:nucleoside-diphosphate-sugar epimerase